MVLRQQRHTQRLLPLVLLAAGAAVFAARCFVPGVDSQRSGVHKEVGQRRQLLHNALLAGLGVSSSLLRQDKASAVGDFLQPMDPKPTDYKKMDLKGDDLQKMIEAEVGDDLGRIMNLKDQCFTATAKRGKTARVSTDTVLVWDANSGKCKEGEVFVHAAGRSDFIPMTSVDGPLKHTYYAAGLEDDWKLYKGKEGNCVPKPTGYQYDISWEIANKDRGGSCE